MQGKAPYQEQGYGEVVAAGGSDIGVVSREVGVLVQTVERWCEDAQPIPARGWTCYSASRVEAVITVAAPYEVGKSVWCREHGVFPPELDK